MCTEKRTEFSEKTIEETTDELKEKQKNHVWLTPVGGIGLNPQFMRGVIGITAKEAKLVENFLRLGVHIIPEVLRDKGKILLQK